MRVARCRALRKNAPGDASQGNRSLGNLEEEQQSVTAEMLRMLGEALDEVDLLGGGKVAAVSNDGRLSAVLSVREY